MHVIVIVIVAVAVPELLRGSFKTL
ncbi:MAG: hypothetical protein ACI8YQ_003145 [Polaribacter sp.]